MTARRTTAGLVTATLLLGGCAVGTGGAAPRCEPGMRLATLAQSVPEAAYVPCVEELPAGWTFEGLHVDDDGATMTLESDRADRDVRVELAESCDIAEATPITPSDEGVRTSQARKLDHQGRLIAVGVRDPARSAGHPRGNRVIPGGPGHVAQRKLVEPMLGAGT